MERRSQEAPSGLEVQVCGWDPGTWAVGSRQTLTDRTLAPAVPHPQGGRVWCRNPGTAPSSALCLTL